MKVFIEQTANKLERNVFNKKTGNLIQSVPINLPYPYPYGFIMNTKADDGQNLDCYVITDEKLEVGSTIECEPLGMVEWFDDGKEDHKVLVAPYGSDQRISQAVKNSITRFALRYYTGQPEKKYHLGKFYGKVKAVSLVRRSSVEGNPFIKLFHVEQ